MPDPNSNPPVLAWTAAREAELERLCAEATPGPWHTGPLTGAGHVWVYSRCDPLAEPVSPRDWYGKAKNALYQVRRVWDQRETPSGNLGDPAWKRAEANADFIAHARTDLPDLLAHTRKQSEVIRGLVGALQDSQWHAGSECSLCGAHRVRGHFKHCRTAQAIAAARELETT